MSLEALGAALLAAAVALYLISRASKRQAIAIRATELSPVSELLALYDAVSSQVGTGSFAQRVAVQGTLTCEQPLQSELGGVPCAAFRYRVERRWEEDYEQRDSDGKTQRLTRTGSEIVASNERRVPFSVGDDDGTIRVLPEGARIETETTVDRFEPGNTKGLLRLGDFKLDLRGWAGGGRRRTLGYHYHEEVLPIGRVVYVLGSAQDSSGTLVICKPSETRDPFLVSLRTREQVATSARQLSIYTQYGAYACGPLGVLLLLAALLQRM